MDLSYAEVSYFITQVALAAASFGVAESDLTIVGQALGSIFNVKCGPPTTIVPSQGAVLESICIDSTCPLAVNATCAMYNGTISKPMIANASLVPNMTASPSASMTMSPSSTGSAPATVSSSASAGAVGMSFAAIAGGLAALFL